MDMTPLSLCMQSNFFVVAPKRSRLVSRMKSQLFNTSDDDSSTKRRMMLFIRMRNCLRVHEHSRVTLLQNLLILFCILAFVFVHVAWSGYHGRPAAQHYRDAVHIPDRTRCIGLHIALKCCRLLEENHGVLIGALSMFLCKKHPNEKWTCQAFRSVTCWEGSKT
eukprot:4244394-Amphidinium_carterae.1